MPRMAGYKNIPVAWIPAIPAGMTVLLKRLYNQGILLKSGR